MASKKKPPLQPGAAVALVADHPDDLELTELEIGKRIASIRQEAFAAGYLMTVRNVAYANASYVILYDLENDPNFRDPFSA